MFRKKIKNYFSNNLFSSILISNLYLLQQAIISFPYRLLSCIKNNISFGAKIIGWKHIYLDGNVVVSHGSFLNVNSRGRRSSSFLWIGQNSFIGKGNFFSVGESIKMGPFCLTASNCSFIGSSHRIENPFLPVLTSGVSLDKNIIVGANCFFGFGASVIGNVKIGHGCVIGAHAVVMKDIPPFSMVIGNPARIIKRYDFNKNKWVSDFDDDICIFAPDEFEYIERLKLNVYGQFPFMPLSASKGFLSDAP